MLYTNFYIIEANQLSDNSIIDICNPIALYANAGNLEDIYRMMNTLQPAFKFFLFFDDNTAIDEKISADIVAFYFLPGYYRKQGRPKILVSNQNESQYLNFTATLAANALPQGFENIDIQHVAKSHTTQIYFDNESSKFRDAYTQLLNGADNNGSELFIKVRNLAEIESLNLIVKEEEEKFAKRDPAFFASKKQINQLEEEKYRANILIQSMEQELANHQSHAALLRSNSHASHLQNYYNNEYEILPGWYKKFGQLIKVLTGKRAFKSVFEKNTKKYKD
jgi:hypothetical protein